MYNPRKQNSSSERSLLVSLERKRDEDCLLALALDQYKCQHWVSGETLSHFYVSVLKTHDFKAEDHNTLEEKTKQKADALKFCQ